VKRLLRSVRIGHGMSRDTARATCDAIGMVAIEQRSNSVGDIRRNEMRRYDVGMGGERVGLDASQSTIVVDAGHPGLTRIFVETDKTDDIGIGDIEDGAGRMVR
jgi:hypothetical protein